MQVQKVQTKDDWKVSFSLIKQLRTHLTEESYFEHLQQMPNYQGWVVFDGTPKAFIGFEERHNFYNERHLFVHDFVTDEKERSKGYGEKLIAALITYAEKHQFSYIALESGIQRTEAHRFYEDKMGFHKWCYSFRKGIDW